MVEHVPSPADFLPGYNAAELLADIRAKGGRVYRMVKPPIVFVLTDSQETATWLMHMGGKPFKPVHLDGPAAQGYLRARGGKREWDIVISTIKIDGEQTLWEAAA